MRELDLLKVGLVNVVLILLVHPNCACKGWMALDTQDGHVNDYVFSPFTYTKEHNIIAGVVWKLVYIRAHITPIAGYQFVIRSSTVAKSLPHR